MSSADLYLVLGVTRAATAKAILRAYRKLSRKYHPEVNPGDPEACDRYNGICRAFYVLGDPARRVEYDQLGPEKFFPPDDPESSPRATTPDLGTYVLAMGEGIIGVLLGLPGVDAGGRQARRGEDIRHYISLGLPEAASGKMVTLRVDRMVGCPRCRGTGVSRGSETGACAICGGTGSASERFGTVTVRSACAACRGRGFLVESACGTCRGTGRQRLTETVEGVIPGGVASGSEVKVIGKGHQGLHGGEPGDLILITRVEEHPQFVRKGDQLYTSVTVTAWQAALGATVAVPTLEGHMSLAIPPGAQGGHRFRLSGKGMPDLKTGRRGDLIVEVTVRVPPPLDEATREAYRHLEEAFAGHSGVR